MFRGIDVALLKFCLQADDGPAPNTPSELPKRDPKDYEWLRAALNNLEDTSSQLKKCITALSDANNVSTKVAALEEIQFYVEDLDLANNLAKMGLGEISEAIRYQIADAPVIEHIIQQQQQQQQQEQEQEQQDQQQDSTNQDSQVRELACWVISTMAQNNPYCQKHIFDQGVFQTIMWLLLRETDARVIAKALGAVSAMIRDFPPVHHVIQSEFNDVFMLFHRLLSHSNCTVRTKTIVLLNRLCEIFGQVVIERIHYTEQPTSILHQTLHCIRTNCTGDSVESEQALQLLLTIVQRHPLPSTSLQLIQDTISKRKIQWQTILTQQPSPNSDQDQDQDQFTSELELVNEILQHCSNPPIAPPPKSQTSIILV